MCVADENKSESLLRPAWLLQGLADPQNTTDTKPSWLTKGQNHSKKTAFGKPSEPRVKSSEPSGKPSWANRNNEHRKTTDTARKPGQSMLHPSWMAKKNEHQQTAGIGGFQGSRVVFDE